MPGPPKYLALDPGETTGWATFDAEGALIAIGQFKMEDFHESLKTLTGPHLDHIIVEDYKNHGFGRNKQRNWSRNQTSKNIGAIETYAEMHGVPVTLQPNTVKSIGCKWGAITVPANHSISHQFEAAGHGVYWLQTNGIRPVGAAIMNKEKLNGE